MESENSAETPENACNLCETGTVTNFPPHDRRCHHLCDSGQGYQWHLLISRPLTNPELSVCESAWVRDNRLEAFVGALPKDVRAVAMQKNSRPQPATFSQWLSQR